MEEKLLDSIRRVYSTLTRKQKKLADYMLAEPDAMCFLTLKELAAATDVSEVTVLKACTALGFANYNELKYEFRKDMALRHKVAVQVQNEYENPIVPDYELSDKERLLATICQEESEQSRNFYSSVDCKELFAAAEMMLSAAHTLICGRGVSMQIAEFLSMRMATLGLPSMVVNTEQIDSVQSVLPLLGRQNLVIAIALPDYYLMTTKLCEFARQRQARILCLTDSITQSPLAPLGDLVLTAPAVSRLFLNTPSPMMALVNLLSSALNIERSSRKSTRPSLAEEFSKLFI